MGNTAKGLAILGSTGSVGRQTLDIVREFPDDFRVVGLAARRSIEALGTQVKEFQPSLVSCEAPESEQASLFANGATYCSLEDMACHADVDTVVTATTGDASIAPTFAAIKAGKNIALANKETVVISGDLVTRAARENGVALLPLDSEPSAIWQCLRGEEARLQNPNRPPYLLTVLPIAAWKTWHVTPMWTLS